MFDARFSSIRLGLNQLNTCYSVACIDRRKVSAIQGENMHAVTFLIVTSKNDVSLVGDGHLLHGEGQVVGGGSQSPHVLTILNQRWKQDRRISS